MSLFTFKMKQQETKLFFLGRGDRTGWPRARGGFLLPGRGSEEVPTWDICPPQPLPVTLSPLTSHKTLLVATVTLGEAFLNLRESVATGKPGGKFRYLGF